MKNNNELYTIYKFDQKQRELLKYNNKANLNNINITLEEYNEIVNIFYTIADEWI